jgi:hypothetical protein
MGLLRVQALQALQGFPTVSYKAFLQYRTEDSYKALQAFPTQAYKALQSNRTRLTKQSYKGLQSLPTKPYKVPYKPFLASVQNG